MAIRHRTHPVWGVQFHPESVGTAAGKQLLVNFLMFVHGGERSCSTSLLINCLSRG